MVFDMGFKAPSLIRRRKPGYTPGCAPLSASFRCGTDSRNTTSDGVLRTLRRRPLSSSGFTSLSALLEFLPDVLHLFLGDPHPPPLYPHHPLPNPIHPTPLHP